MTFVGQVVPALGAGRTTGPSRGRQWITTCPLRITDAPGRHRHIETNEFVFDLFGFSSVSDAELVAVGYRFARNADLIELDAIITGSGVLVIRQPRQVTVVTDLAGVWPVFYATVAGSLVYSSCAAVIAAQVGREVDEQWLAARLLSGSVPETWSEGSPYRHVQAVPAGGVLLVGSSARPVVVCRELPLASVGLAEGAQRLAGALTTAVRGRTQAYREMSMDLSGGLDSSTVVALAAATRHGSTLPAITVVATELDGDDPAHARQVAAAIPGLQHVELPLPREVDPYTALTEIPHTDEPFQDVSIFARLRWWMAAVNRLGSRGHLSGDGGDAVLLAPPAYLADLARRGTRGELRRHAADWARLRHRPAHRLATLATRLARTTRAQALEDYARSLEHDSDSPTGPRRWEDLINWAPAPDCHHWFTRHARQLTATALRTTASTCSSGGGPGDAASLAMIHAYGRAHRIHTALAAAQSVQLHAPYLDDAVVTACLAVPAANRASPWQAKPLLRAAMTGLVPESVLTRSTKGDYSMLTYRGLARHHHVLSDLLTSSRLASLGLLDDSAVRADLARGAAGLPIPLAALDQVLGTELWLRTLPTADDPAHHRERAHA
ncbi:MAG: albusnodin/ikarugamycin family macrolactam cyclase [Pseudonocardiales bacterium]|nr:albusnodin/ikarugamycin family macrolactam cyclase [Pseudonocardiales bacterium]